MKTAGAFLFLTLAAQFTFAQTYFPAGALDSVTAAQQYSKTLQALHEPSLLELAQRDPNAEVYRLLWLRESDRPASVRFVRKPSGTGWFHRHVLTGSGGAQTGRLTDSGMSWSWKSRTASFLSAIERAGFWNLPTFGGDDGSTAANCRAHWILEGIRNGQYHVVDRCSPDQADPVRVVGMLAIKFGSLRVGKSNVY